MTENQVTYNNSSKEIHLALSFPREDGVKQAVSLDSKVVDMCFFTCNNIKYTIDKLRTHKKKTQFAACLEGKNCEEKFALLYDFVDAFVISAFDELSEDIDPLINLRLYNDQYKEIYLRLDDNCLSEDLDEVLAYAKLSNVDGLVISNPSLLKEAVEKSGNILKIIADKVDTKCKLEQSIKCGATMAIITYPWRITFAPLRKLLLRKLL